MPGNWAESFAPATLIHSRLSESSAVAAASASVACGGGSELLVLLAEVLVCLLCELLAAAIMLRSGHCASFVRAVTCNLPLIV